MFRALALRQSRELCYVTLRYVLKLSCIVLCYIILYYVTLCYVMLRSVHLCYVNKLS